MGNTRDNTPPRKKNQPQQLLPSGENQGISGESSYGRQLVNTIKLIKLDLDVLEKVREGDKVLVLFRSTRYLCLFNNQRMGDVPNYYNNRLFPVEAYSAIIVELKKNPLSVTIELK